MKKTEKAALAVYIISCVYFFIYSLYNSVVFFAGLMGKPFIFYLWTNPVLKTSFYIFFCLMTVSDLILIIYNRKSASSVISLILGIALAVHILVNPSFTNRGEYNFILYILWTIMLPLNMVFFLFISKKRRNKEE